MDAVLGKAKYYPVHVPVPIKKRKIVATNDYKYDIFKPHVKKNLKKAKDFENVLLEYIEPEDLKSRK